MRTIWTLTCLLLLQSCVGEKSSLKFSSPPVIGNIGDLSDEQFVAFSNLKSRVLEPAGCVSCHSGFATSEGLLPFITKGSPDESVLFTSVENGSMPLNRNPLTTAQLEIVRLYIESFSVPEEEDGKVTFAQIQQEILAPSCVSCHARMTTEENLLRWVDREDPLASKFLRVVENGSMPKGAPPLAPEKQELIRRYLSSL